MQRNWFAGCQLLTVYYILTIGFWPRVRARALRAPVFLSTLQIQGGRCAPPTPIATLLLLSRPWKMYNIYWAAHIKSFFLSTGPQRLWNIRSPAPRPAHRSFADPFDNILGLKCTGATVSPNFFRLFLFCIAFGSFLFAIPFFFFSPF